MDIDQPDPDLLTVEVAARILGADPRFVRLMAGMGLIEAERDGYELRILRRGLTEFQARRPALHPAA